MKKYDAIVIGSGQAGTPLSKKLAESGLKTALIEKRWVGGTCVNDGCTPTKAMISSARVAYLANNGKELGIDSGKIRVDIAKIVRRKNEIVHRIRKYSEDGIQKTENLDLIYGTALFTDTKQITVQLKNGGKEILTADQFFINTGAKPMIPEINGLENIRYFTSTTILDLKEIPKHLLIVGAGYVGMEIGQMFRRFGSKVTMIENSGRILPKEDEDVAAEIEKILTGEGVTILTNSKVKSFLKRRDKVAASVGTGGKEKMITCTHVLIAAGREPQSRNLNPERTGVKVNEKGYIIVDEFLETSTKGIFALGDVNGGPPFTHVAYDDYRIVINNLTKKPKKSTTERILPYCMFTDPQLGRVGISENDAKKKGLDVLIASMPNTAVARSIETGDTRGFMKAIVDAKSGKILGASILGTEGGEVATVLQMAIMGGVTWQQIHDGVFAHPTFSESLNNLFVFDEK